MTGEVDLWYASKTQECEEYWDNRIAKEMAECEKRIEASPELEDEIRSYFDRKILRLNHRKDSGLNDIERQLAEKQEKCEYEMSKMEAKYAEW